MADEQAEQDIFAAAERARDDQGRFASNAKPEHFESEPQSVAEQASVPEDVQPEADHSAEPGQSGRNSPPPGLIEERRKRQESERLKDEKSRENDELRQKLAELTGTVSTLVQQGRQQAPAPQQAPEPQAEPEFDWANPYGSVNSVIEQRLQADRQRQMYNDRLIAESRFGEDKVGPAIEAFDSALQANRLDPITRSRVMSAPNPYAEAVKWHQEQTVRDTVGNDPSAYFQREFERRMSEDPDFQRSVIQKLQTQARGGSGQQQQRPLVTLPSVGRAQGASGIGASAPLGEEDIFLAAPQKMGRR